LTYWFNWEWKKLEPEGWNPLHRDKLMGWEYRKKIFFFGGFGTPPQDDDRRIAQYEYVSDRSLLCYCHVNFVLLLKLVQL